MAIVMRFATFAAVGTLALPFLAACTAPVEKASYVAVMVDNHELARPYQRGLDDAAWVEEFFVEGFITRFMAAYDAKRFPASVGPVRSVRSYFLDGAVPAVDAMFHIGGSPDALARLAASGAVTSFNGTRFDRFFASDDVAPAPHHRFLTREGFDALFARATAPSATAYPFPAGPFRPYQPASNIMIDMRGPVHDVTYRYDRTTGRYVRFNRDRVQASAAANLLVLETDVAVKGELGRLAVRTRGTGDALLFRDGGVATGTWSKKDGGSYAFKGEGGAPWGFSDGQTWMIVVDDLGLLTWNAFYEYNFDSEQ